MIWSLDALAIPAGGKAEACARLLQAGFPVPDGFVVEPFGGAGLLADALAAWSPDCRFAVRSSALDEDGVDHSFAGAHETLLDVARDEVPRAVARCASSLYAPRAVAYRVQRHLPTHDLRMMVLVQRMVEPVVAGVAFTADPFGDPHEMLINAAWGHGEAVVSGWVEPDELRVDRESGAVRAFRVGAKRQRAKCRNGHTVVVETSRSERRRCCLSAEHVGELARLLAAVHHHCGGPRDVEWCHDGHRFWILQARPLTAQGETSASQTEWTRANLVEVLPEVGSPQAVEANVRLIDRAMRGWYGTLLGADALGPCAQRICGRPWLNLSRLGALCRATGTDPSTVLHEVGHVRRVEAEAERPDLTALLRHLPALARMLARQAWVACTLGAWFARLDRVRERLSRRDPGKASDGEVAAVLQAAESLAVSAMRRTYAIGGMTVYKMALERVLATCGIDAERFLQVQLAAAEPTVSARQGFDLLELAAQARREPRVRAWFRAVHHRQRWDALGRWREWLRGTGFRAAFEDFLRRYGHRGPFESDWSLPRYAEDPQPLLFAVARLVAGPEDPSPAPRLRRQAAEAAAQWAACEPRMSLATRGLVRWLLGRVRHMYALRERNRSAFVRVEAELRRWHLALAARFQARGWLDERDDYFQLYLDEVTDLLEGRLAPAAIRAIVARRRVEHDAWRGLPMPLYGTAASVAEHLLAGTSGEGTRHREQITPLETWPHGRVDGVCLSPGLVEGEVVVLRTPHDFTRMLRGAVLVAPAVDPSWIPLFTLASAVVVEVGGTLSHAATVAREYGLPMIASVPDATRILHDGDRVRVDATHGVLELLAPAYEVEQPGGPAGPKLLSS